MNTAELRIGNLIRFNLTGDILEVLGIERDKVLVFYQEAIWIESKYFEPVELTKLWLRDWGFGDMEDWMDDDEDMKFFCADDQMYEDMIWWVHEEEEHRLFLVEKDEKFWFGDPDFADMCDMIEVNSLHQFQNLVYATGGKELDKIDLI